MHQCLPTDVSETTNLIQGLLSNTVHETHQKRWLGSLAVEIKTCFVQQRRKKNLCQPAREQQMRLGWTKRSSVVLMTGQPRCCQQTGIGIRARLLGPLDIFNWWFNARNTAKCLMSPLEAFFNLSCVRFLWGEILPYYCLWMAKKTNSEKELYVTYLFLYHLFIVRLLYLWELLGNTQFFFSLPQNMGV